MNRTRNAVCLVAGLAVALTLIGCATVPPQQALRDNSQCLTVVVKSDPPGAQVYGAGGGSPGSLLGITPIEIRYTRQVDAAMALFSFQAASSIHGTAPIEETLETEYRTDVWGNCDTRAVFKCFVVMDGYLPYRIYEEVEKSHNSAFKAFYGGHREFTAYLQSKQPIVVAPATQATPQPSKDGKVAVSCNIEGADIFVDGAFVGNSPSTLALNEGTHTIEVKKEGRATFKREIRVLAGSETSMRAELSQ